MTVTVAFAVTAAVIVSWKVMVLVIVPEVTVMVIVNVPGVAVLLAVSVITSVEEVGVEKEAVTPEGRPETAILGVPVAPVTVMVQVPEPPAITVNPPPHETEIDNAGVTVSAMAVDEVSEPEAPVMVMLLVAADAVLATVKVITLVEVAGLAPIAAVTPAGRPETARVTLPANGLTSVTVIVSVPLAPCTIDKADAEGFSVKLPAAAEVTVSAMVVDADSEPEAPVIVTVDVPTAAAELAAKATTLDPVVGLVANAAVTPVGNPLAARVTLPANGLTSATEIVSVPLAPCAIDKVGAEGFSVKLPALVAPQVTPLIANDAGIALVTLFQVPLNPMPE